MLDVVKSVYLYFYPFKINSNFSKNIYTEFIVRPV